MPGLLPEPRSVDHHDVLLSNQFLHEDFVALGYVDPRIGVERSTRRDATNAGRSLAPLLREIAARSQFALHFDEMILRPFERGLDRYCSG